MQYSVLIKHSVFNLRVLSKVSVERGGERARLFLEERAALRSIRFVFFERFRCYSKILL